MAETFWMSKEGVPPLSAQIDRARVAAERAKGHVEQHGTLSLGEVGVLPDTFGVTRAHERAVGMLRGTMGDLVERTRYVVEGIGASVLDYESVDDETSQVFDGLTSMLGRGAEPPSFVRYGLSFPGANFSDLMDPTQVLTDPTFGPQQEKLWEFELQDWFNPTAYVRELVKEFTGRDPFAESVEALSGDWKAFQRVLFMSLQIGQFSEREGRNLARAALDLPMVWTGREADAAQWYLHALANATTDFTQICRQLVDAYSAAVASAKEFNDMASDILADVVTNAGLAAATAIAARVPHPLVRWPAAAALYLIVQRIIDQVTDLFGYLDQFLTALHGFSGMVNAIKFTAVNSLVVRRVLQ